MKLKEQLAVDAQDFHYENREMSCEGTWGCCYTKGYLAGFEKAKGLVAVKILTSRNLTDILDPIVLGHLHAIHDAKICRELGEEEV